MTSFILQSSGKTSVKTGRFAPSAYVYWSRFGLGVIVALLCYFLQLKGSTGVSLAAFIYLLSVILVKRFTYMRKGFESGGKTVILGAGTYIFTWAGLWILLYSLIPY